MQMPLRSGISSAMFDVSGLKKIYIYLQLEKVEWRENMAIDLQLAEYSLRTCKAGWRTLKNAVLFLMTFIVTWRAPVKRVLTHSLRSEG